MWCVHVSAGSALVVWAVHLPAASCALRCPPVWDVHLAASLLDKSGSNSCGRPCRRRRRQQKLCWWRAVWWVHLLASSCWIAPRCWSVWLLFGTCTCQRRFFPQPTELVADHRIRGKDYGTDGFDRSPGPRFDRSRSRSSDGLASCAFVRVVCLCGGPSISEPYAGSCACACRPVAALPCGTPNPGSRSPTLSRRGRGAVLWCCRCPWLKSPGRRVSGAWLPPLGRSTSSNARARSFRSALAMCVSPQSTCVAGCNGEHRRMPRRWCGASTPRPDRCWLCGETNHQSHVQLVAWRVVRSWRACMRESGQLSCAWGEGVAR